ncbi:TIGR00730 family Rossman fold protein [Acidobacterium sp. S8]|uniref:LOG family protein n=1 Tax=Acidobacterium sp. S8 TaxID=1641854 RepID=UPI00131ADCE7|nr:TIGR00730 family Rossman fold protein [Acidobacterium sp. S8]
MPKPIQPSICVFCGSADGADPAYAQTARELGERIAAAGMGLVYGGATVGLMGIVAEASIGGGAEVIGVMPEVLMDREIAHRRITHFHVVTTMHERKALMYDHADAFVALPGGYGTLDEFMEIVTWAQLKIHQKPCILINTSGYYDSFLAFLDHAVTQGFLKPENRKLVRVAADAETALAIARSYWETQRIEPSHDESFDNLIR